MLKQMRGKTVDNTGRIKGFWSIRATESGRKNRSCTRQVEIESLDWDKWPFLQPQLVRNYITFNMFISGRWSSKPYSRGHQLLKQGRSVSEGWDCSTLGECFFLPFLQGVNDKPLNLLGERLSSIFTFLRCRTLYVASLMSWSMRLDFLATILMLLGRIWWSPETALPYFNTNDHMNKAYQPPPSTSQTETLYT